MKPRCSECQWVHEADSVAGTSFLGVGLCQLHAAAPRMRDALRAFLRAPSIGSSGPGSVTIEVTTFNLVAARAALRDVDGGQ